MAKKYSNFARRVLKRGIRHLFFSAIRRAVLYLGFVENKIDVIKSCLGLASVTLIRLKNGLTLEAVPGIATQTVLFETFYLGTYSTLRVQDKTVVDVGAFIGDSAIFFSRKGARYVYSFEANPVAFKIASNNLRRNKVRNVTIYNEAIGRENGYITVDVPVSASPNYIVRESKGGTRITSKSLDTIVEELKLKDAMLKMDCQGCEYDALVFLKGKTLNAFSEIIVEYHQGATPLLKIFQGAGFEIKVLRRTEYFDAETNRVSELGILHACR